MSIASIRRSIRDRLSPETRARLQPIKRALAFLGSDYIPRYLRALNYAYGPGRRVIPYRPGNRVWKSSVPFAVLTNMEAGVYRHTYRDIPFLKWPFEIAIYEQLVWRLKPRTILEVGSFRGGSALWFSDMMRTYEIPGRIVSIDITVPKVPYQRDNIEFLECDANYLERVLTPEFVATLERPILWIEDANHYYETCLAALRVIDRFIEPGEYLIVEDGSMSDLGITNGEPNGGPSPAISRFLMETKGRYEIDAALCDKYGHNATSNPNGYLRRVAN